jgi:aspartyl-tRNA(Asn)/glutamyl-tRNA(Gln) amidotransferase subunit A
VLSSGYYEAYYAKAQKVRALLKRDYAEAFEKCDVVLTPTSPTTAFKIGEKSDDPVAMYLSDIYTASANLVGIPGISIPCGVSAENLPIGLQLVGRNWSENLLLNLAHAYEKAFPFNYKPIISITN